MWRYLRENTVLGSKIISFINDIWIFIPKKDSINYNNYVAKLNQYFNLKLDGNNKLVVASEKNQLKAQDNEVIMKDD